MKYEVVKKHWSYDQTKPPVATFNEYSDASGEVKTRGADYTIREKLEMASAKVSRAEVLRFWFNPGWADFTVSEDTGEFTIHSDWGDYLYRWNLNGIGEKTFKEFLMRADTPYLASKLFQCKGSEAHRELDFDKTVAEFEKHIKEEGGEFEEEMLDDLRNLEHTEYENTLYSQIEQTNHLSYIQDRHELFQYRPKATYLFLRDTLLPFFQEHLRQNQDNKGVLG